MDAKKINLKSIKSELKQKLSAGVIIPLYLCGTRDQTQGFELARKMLFSWVTSSAIQGYFHLHVFYKAVGLCVCTHCVCVCICVYMSLCVCMPKVKVGYIFQLFNEKLFFNFSTYLKGLLHLFLFTICGGQKSEDNLKEFFFSCFQQSCLGDWAQVTFLDSEHLYLLLSSPELHWDLLERSFRWTISSLIYLAFLVTSLLYLPPQCWVKVHSSYGVKTACIYFYVSAGDLNSTLCVFEAIAPESWFQCKVGFSGICAVLGNAVVWWMLAF